MVDVDKRVIAAVRAWAAAGVDGARALADQRRALDPLLLPALVREVAEITAEQLLVVLDRPSAALPAAGQKPVPFLGIELSQEQGRRAAAWLDEQAEIAASLALDVEAWAERLGDGMRATLERLRGRPLSSSAAAVADVVADGALASAAAGFAGGADPRTSEKAGLRGLLSARAFKKK